MASFYRSRAWFQGIISPQRRLGLTLRHYVIRQVAVATATALVGLTLVILTKDLLSFADFVINRGFGITVVAMIAFYETVPLLSRALPFAVLIGTLVGLGGMRANLELVAIEASGISRQRLVGPVLAFATVMMTGALYLTLFTAPWAIRSLDEELNFMTRANPGLALRPGIVREFNGIKLLAREISAHGDQLRGVLVWIPEQGQILFAERAQLAALADGHNQLTLLDGVMLPGSPRRGETTHFASFEQSLVESATPVRRRDDFLSGSSLDEVTVLGWSNNEDKDLAQRAQIEWHQRLSYPVATLCFGLLAVPLALMGQRFSRATGAAIGLLVTLLYYGMVQLSTGLVQTGVLSVSSGGWLSNVVTSLLALGLLWLDSRRPRQSRNSLHETALTPRSLNATPHYPRRYILPRYIARQYLLMLLLSFAALLIGYVLVDVLERLQWFARYHADLATALQFYRLWTPILASRIIPMAVLLATALAVSLLTVHNEIIGMRACGIAVTRAFAPVVFIASVVAFLYFVLNEVVLPRANTQVDDFKSYQIKNHARKLGPQQQMLWLRTQRVYSAAELDVQRGEARDLTIYDLGDNGLPMRRIDASRAHHLSNGVWELTNALQTEISTDGIRQTSAPSQAQLGEGPREVGASAHLSVWELANAIRDAETRGYSATGSRVDFHLKLAAPVACFLLSTVALLFAMSGPPFPRPTVMLLVSGILGIGYMLLNGVCAALGYGGFLSPSVAGWALPTILLLMASGFAWGWEPPLMLVRVRQ